MIKFKQVSSYGTHWKGINHLVTHLIMQLTDLSNKALFENILISLMFTNRNKKLKHTVRRNNKKPMVSHKSRYNISIISPWKLPNIWNNTPKKHSLVVAISFWWPSRSYWLFDVLYWQSNFSYWWLMTLNVTRRKPERRTSFEPEIRITSFPMRYIWPQI